MAPSTVAARQSLAASLKPLLRARKSELTVGEMVRRVEHGDGPGAVLFVLTLPVLLPLPPGVSMLLALPLLMIALQIVAGRRKLWMPDGLSRRPIDRAALVKLLHRLLPPLTRFEALVHPRLRFLTGPIGARVVGLACTLIAVVLVLPIPFANLVPAIALTMFALGLTRRDGLLILAGYGLMALASVVIVLGAHGLAVGLRYLLSLV
jgi:hypothetical protein